MKSSASMQTNCPIILMYHGVVQNAADSPPDREVGADIYDVTLDNFRGHLQWLKDQGYRALTLDEAQDHNQKKIVLTFDDGEMNNSRLAVPVLREFLFSAYFFVIAKRVGRPGYMGFPELKKLREAGMVVGSHGFSHEILTGLLDSQIEQEFVASRRYLEQNLEIPIDSVSIPRGFCNDKIIAMAGAAGYKNIFISERPCDLKADCLSRVAVKAGWSAKRLAASVTGQEPVSEKIKKTGIRIAKIILTDGGYNGIRSLIIKIFK